MSQPAARAVECGDQFVGRLADEMRKRSSRPVVWHNPINSSHGVAGAHIDAGQTIGGNPFGVFDDHAVHVDDPQCAVRAVLEIDGAEPVVRRRQEFGLLLGGGAAAGKRRPERFQNAAGDEIMHRLAHEGIVVIFGSQQVIAINDGAARGGHAIRAFGMVESPQRATDGVKMVGILLLGRARSVLGEQHTDCDRRSDRQAAR